MNNKILEQLHKVSIMSVQHNSNIAFDEPKWNTVNIVNLPRLAFAFRGDSKDSTSWKYPHHWLRGDIHEGYARGILYLHEEGLFKAWTQATSDHSKGLVPMEPLAELRKHLADIGAGLKSVSFAADLSEGELKILDNKFITAGLLKPSDFVINPVSKLSKYLL